MAAVSASPPPTSLFVKFGSKKSSRECNLSIRNRGLLTSHFASFPLSSNASVSVPLISSFLVPFPLPRAKFSAATLSRTAASHPLTPLASLSFGVAESRGKSRPSMEDAHFALLGENISAVAGGRSRESERDGKRASFFAVFDGHGGNAVAQFLKEELWNAYKKNLAKYGSNIANATLLTFQEVDQITLAPPSGLFGALRERGMGGSKCGSTANTVLVLEEKEGLSLLVCANVGDARTVLSRGGVAMQLSVDHKPDVEEERRRIERKNPNPKLPLVRQVGGQWRVGGLLALSRAFGDVYLKDWSDGTKEGARGGFGLTAEPSVFIEEITGEDEFVIAATDGLWDFVSPQEAVDVCKGKNWSDSRILSALAKQLLDLAVSKGSTDDLTVLIAKL